MQLLYDVAVAFSPVWTCGSILLYVQKTVVKEVRYTRTVLSAFFFWNKMNETELQ